MQFFKQRQAQIQRKPEDDEEESRNILNKMWNDIPSVERPSDEGGLMGSYGLKEWFSETFSDSEITYIKEKMSRVMNNSNTIDSGPTTCNSQTAAGFLDSLAYNFGTKKDISIAIRFLEKAEELFNLDSMSASEIHYFCLARIGIYYKDRENPKSLEKTIYWCKKMIEVAPQAYLEIREYEKSLYTPYERKTLPKELVNATATSQHKGFEQLAIIEYKRGNYQEVINICNLAKKSKFDGDWDYRIEQAKKKMSK